MSTYKIKKIKELIQDHYGLNNVPDSLARSILGVASEYDETEYYGSSASSDSESLDEKISRLEDKIEELDRRLG